MALYSKCFVANIAYKFLVPIMHLEMNGYLLFVSKTLQQKLFLRSKWRWYYKLSSATKLKHASIFLCNKSEFAMLSKRQSQWRRKEGATIFFSKTVFGNRISLDVRTFIKLLNQNPCLNNWKEESKVLWGLRDFLAVLSHFTDFVILIIVLSTLTVFW